MLRVPSFMVTRAAASCRDGAKSSLGCLIGVSRINDGYRRRTVVSWQIAPAAVWPVGGLRTVTKVDLQHHQPHSQVAPSRTLSMSGMTRRGEYYTTLGVPHNASAAEVKDAYRSLARQLHPDKMQQKSKKEQAKAHQRFVEINAAFAVLGVESKRRRYDMERAGPIGMQASTAGYAGTYGPSPSSTQGPEGDFDDFGFYQGDQTESPYKIVSNSTVVVLAVAAMLIGALLHLWRFKEEHTKTVEILADRSQVAARSLNTAKLRAQQNGAELQLAMLRDRQREESISVVSSVSNKENEPNIDV